MIQLLKHIIEQPSTRHKLKIISESIEDAIDFTETFVAADNVVGAQFYYTNPILYLITVGDIRQHACLYGNLYLLSIEEWEYLEYKPIFAVNQAFIDRIGSIADSYTFNPQTLIEQHLEHGLYLVGIKHE
ncbi:MAG: hypothetical protein OXU23_17325 [Candidatus Poribacteria bacterium]|nr:hypothetical protein [Candidatus Poribacteria bacterium]